MLTIGEVARRAGLESSALRYYERIGLLTAPERVSGRRRYPESVLARLRVITFARGCGFSLAEIRQLFSGRPYSKRMRTLAARKLTELEQAIDRFRAMHELLESSLGCDCLSPEQCGQRLPAGPAPTALIRFP
ncbi:MAG: MerR family transcriptional regulator [Candidatus Eisenbacteria bacterium]